MATTAEYLNQLQKDKETLVNNLVEKGVDASNEETFTSLAPKVADISSGSSELKTSDFSNLSAGREISGGNKKRAIQDQLIAEIPNLDLTSIGSELNYIFYGFRGTKIGTLSSGTNVTSIGGMLMENTELSSFPKINFDTSKISYADYCCFHCKTMNDFTELEKLNLSSCTSMNNFFNRCTQLKHVPNISYSQCINIQQLFYSTGLEEIEFEIPDGAKSLYYFLGECSDLKRVVLTNTGHVTNFQYLLRSCPNLESVAELDCSSAINMSVLLQTSPNDYNLTDLGGFKDLGKAYTQKTANYLSYELDLTRRPGLSYESLTNVINKVYDLNLTYDVANGGTLYTQKIKLHADSLALLSDDDIAIATAKGWTVTTS